MEKQNVGWKKNLSVEQKMSVGEFPLPKTDMPGMSGIPCNARPKNGRRGKKRNALGPIGGGGGKEENPSFGKEKIFVAWKNKMLVGRKTCRLKKNVGGRISPAKNRNVRNVRNSLECNTEKRQRRGKEPPRAYREGEKKLRIFLSVGEKKMLVGKKNASGRE